MAETKNKELELEVFQPPLRQSSIAVCLRCKRKYFYRYRLALYPKWEGVKKAPSLGRYYHRFMEEGPNNTQKVIEEINKDISEIESIMDEEGDLLGNHQKDIKVIEECRDKSLMMARLFWEKYPPLDKHAVMDKEKKIVKQIKIPTRATDVYGGTPVEDIEDTILVTLQGTLDEVLRNTEDDAIWIRDKKSSSMSVSAILTAYKYSLQCRMYRLLGALEYQQPPKGFVLDYMKTPTIKYCGKDKDFEAYVDRCKEWYKKQEEETIRSFSIEYNEPIVPIELWEALREAHTYTIAEPKVELFSRDVTGSYCKHFNRRCPYYELCDTDPDGWEGIIEEKFEQRPPEPIQTEDEDEEKKGSEKKEEGKKEGKEETDATS